MSSSDQSKSQLTIDLFKVSKKAVEGVYLQAGPAPSRPLLVAQGFRKPIVKSVRPQSKGYNSLTVESTV